MRFRVSLSILRSYEGFGALFVTLAFSDGRGPVGPVALSGRHDQRTSVPEAAAVAVIDAPLVPFNATVRAPNGTAEAPDPSAAKAIILGVYVSPVVG